MMGSFLRFLYVWAFDRPNTRRGWLVGQWFLVLDTLSIAWLTWWLFGLGPWAWPVAVPYLLFTLMLAWASVYGFLWCPYD